MSKLTMKQMPVMERPYEKLLLYGEEALSNAELLAIILKNGTKSETVVEIAQRVLMLDEKNNLSNISKLEINELIKVKGIGKVKAIQIKAVLELAKRIAMPISQANIKIENSKDVYELLRYQCINQTKELFWVLNLDIKNNVIKISKIAMGGKAKISININDVFRESIKISASSIIIVHNHPSGDTKPSQADILFTYKVIEASKILEIEVLDHLIISNSGYTSLRQEQLF